MHTHIHAVFVNTPMNLTPPHAAMTGSRGIADIEFPSVSRSTAIGISVAIAGNILISFALNLQKLAHARLERARAEHRSAPELIEEERNANPDGGLDTVVELEMDLPPEVEREARVWNPSFSETSSLVPRLETEPLIPLPLTTNAELQPSFQTYGALFPNLGDGNVRAVNDSPRQRKHKVTKPSGTRGAVQHGRQPKRHESNIEGQESEYLKSKLWYALPSFYCAAKV
jgi:magnesium transporter